MKSSGRADGEGSGCAALGGVDVGDAGVPDWNL